MYARLIDAKASRGLQFHDQIDDLDSIRFDPMLRYVGIRWACSIQSCQGPMGLGTPWLDTEEE